jgi:ubiquinone/menaquinone biosynthesis C-methylase UbiE
LKFSCDAVKYLDFSSLESFMSDAVREWYDSKANYEWKRLFQDAYHRLEFIVHMHFLDKYLPKEGLILDAGGGPGRYTIELAKKVITLYFWTYLQNVWKLQKGR